MYMCDVTQNKNRHCTATALFHYFKRSCYCVVFKKEAVVSGEYRPSMCIIHNCYILKLTLFKCILSHECIEKLYAFINTKCICSTYQWPYVSYLVPPYLECKYFFRYCKCNIQFVSVAVGVFFPMLQKYVKGFIFDVRYFVSSKLFVCFSTSSLRKQKTFFEAVCSCSSHKQCSRVSRSESSESKSTDSLRVDSESIFWWSRLKWAIFGHFES